MTAPEFGIFARVFPIGPAPNVANAIADAGYTLAQLNLKAIGFSTIPEPAEWRQLDPAIVRAAFASAGVSCWGVSCSYNMAHPDPAVRRSGTEKAVELIGYAAAFGARAVTLCTGSRHADRMWAYHPDNSSKAAWGDMRAELDILLAAAAPAGVVLGIEPEHGNVINDAEAAVRLYSELGHDGDLVGIVADSANLLAGHSRAAHYEVLERSFVALGDRIVCLHAKDVIPWQEALEGRGVVDYRHVAQLYSRLGLTAPVIVQDVTPEQAAPALRLLRDCFTS
jgi:sugar phosphate isomerase/epimerase